MSMMYSCHSCTTNRMGVNRRMLIVYHWRFMVENYFSTNSFPKDFFALSSLMVTIMQASRKYLHVKVILI
jgi:hypothetical protein